MSFLVALKVLCDLALLASAAAVVIPWFSLEPANFFPAMLCCALGVFCAAVVQKRGAVRYGGVIPCALSLLFCGGAVDFVVVVPMAAYCAYLIHGGNLTLSYDTYREFFIIGAKFLAGCFLFASINVDWLRVLPYGVLYFAAGAFLLRNLRLGSGSNWRRMVLNLMSLLGTVVLGAVLCLVVYGALRLLLYPAGALYFGVMDGLLELVREGVYLFGEVITYLIMFFAALLYKRRSEGVEVNGSEGGGQQMKPPENVEPNELVNFIAGAALILLAAALLIFLARKAAKLMKRRRAPQGRRVYTQRIPVIGDQRGAKVTGNRARVRAIYRKFLALVLERGGEIRPDHTSKDVMHIASTLMGGRECAALRDVYIAARYDSEREVTPQQVKEAKGLYNQLKEQ